MYIDRMQYTTRPTDERIPQENAIHDRLAELNIPFVRVDHDRADTIEICAGVEEVLGANICKNLFLCNRQQTDFYLLLMPGDKPFKTKYLSAQLGCSRLSFAGDEHLAQHLQTIPGSVSSLELLFDTEHRVRLVIDKDLMKEEYIGCHPGISTSSLKLKREDLLRFVASTGHEPTYIDLPDPRTMEE